MLKEIKFVEQIQAYLVIEKRTLENKLFMLRDKFKQPAWYSDRNYLNYEIGQSENKIQYINYMLNILENRLKKLKEKHQKIEQENQVKI